LLAGSSRSIKTLRLAGRIKLKVNEYLKGFLYSLAELIP
jgi:hypothetical protein